jgi:hypothetical protein
LDLLFDLTRLWDENKTHRGKTAHVADSEDGRGANKQLKADLTPLSLLNPSSLFAFATKVKLPTAIASDTNGSGA